MMEREVHDGPCVPGVQIRCGVGGGSEMLFRAMLMT